MGSELRISVSLRPTAVSYETVDRYIIAVRRCYRSIRRMQDCGSLVLWIDVWDSGSTDCFVCMRLFGLLLCFYAAAFVCSVFGLMLFLLFT